MIEILKEKAYQKLIISIYQESQYDKAKAIHIANIVIKDLLEYGLDKRYKHRILKDLNITLAEYNTKPTDRKPLTEIEAITANAITFEAMLKIYRM
jgi:hypothetical protein